PMKLEVCASAQTTVHDRLLKDDAADAPRLPRMLGDVQAREPGGAPRGLDRRREHADRGRLSRSVGPEQAERLAGGDPKVDPLYGFDAAGVGLGEVSHLDRGRAGGLADHHGRAEATVRVGCHGWPPSRVIDSVRHETHFTPMTKPREPM